MNRWLEIKALSGRLFIQSKRRPIVLFAGLFQPFIWLFLFSTVFKNSPLANLSGATSYLAFITPGTLIFTAFTGALNGGVPLLFDREQGFLDRLLVAPLVSRNSIIIASGIHISAMTLIQCTVILVLTALMGVRFQGGLFGFAVLIAIILLITFLFTTISLILAFSLRYHFELLSLIMIVSLPMVFLSSAFAPMSYMPGWLQGLVCFNPITLAVEPMRALFFNPDWQMSQPLLDGPLGHWSFSTCLFILVGFCALFLFLARPVTNRKMQ
ncbi:MAG: ABC transporter permease [Acidobacteria bacterium]|nr:ABC transporter permease [Acidobacteriota bacterium]MCB9398099.1 ABC transporter permease [Acidobacteriota bacterium]